MKIPCLISHCFIFMRKNFYLFFIVINFATLNLMKSQNRIIAQQYHGWYMYFGTHYLIPKWGIHSEYQWRRNDIVQNWQQSLSRVGIIFKVHDALSLTVGYGHILTYPYGEQPVPQTFLEHRIWEQALIQHKIQNVDFKHRYRLEQRWLNLQNDWKYLNRLRYQLTIEKKLNNFLLLSFYDEIFIGFGKNVQKNIFEQNRLYAALGWNVLKNTSIRFGYMNQILIKPNGIHQELNHTLQVSLHLNYLLLPKNERRERRELKKLENI